jgi:putative ABC transport system permease protein
MIGHYLLSALLSFRKAPFTTAANVLTLALGLACFIAALGIAAYWRASDMHHPNADRTFVLGQGFQPASGGRTIPVQAISSAAPARYLAEDFPEVEQLARVHSLPKRAFAADARKVLLDTAYAEPSLLAFLDLDFIAGDPATALADPSGVVLTKAAAERLFGSASAVGRDVLLDGKRQGVVTGVIAPLRQPSFMGAGPDSLLRFEALAHWRLSPVAAEIDGPEQWISTQGFILFRLKPGASVDAVNGRLEDFVARRMPADQKAMTKVELEAFPINEITTRGLDNRMFSSSPLALTMTGVLIALGALVLLIACLNYANLATAQATVTAKEVGLRKVLGASPAEVMAQSWCGSLVQVLVAAALAILALAIAGPFLRAALGVDILYLLKDGAGALFLLGGLLLIVAVAAGAYPALVLADVRPARALQSGRARSGPRFVPRILVGVQFGAAGFLLILLAVSAMQRSHLEKVALAPHSDPVVILNEIQGLGVDGPALLAELRQQPGVKIATLSERVPWTESMSLLSVVRSPEEGATEHPVFGKHVSHDYFQTLSLRPLAGRVFDPAHETVTRSIEGADPSQPIPVVIDERMSQAVGFASPQAAVGQTLYFPISLMRLAGSAAAQPMAVVGVVESDRNWLGANPAEGNLYMFGPDSPFGNGLYPILKISRDNVPATVGAISRVWDRFAPATPADVRFFDQMFEENYRQYRRIGQLFGLLANVALLIAALGLLGIAVQVVARRRHEIAVRKTLGSTTLEAAWLLLSDFARPVIIANLLAWPFAYLAARAYLSAFAQQTELTLLPFLLSLAASLAVAFIVVAGQTLGAARVSPAQALRDQ